MVVGGGVHRGGLGGWGSSWGLVLMSDVLVLVLVLVPVP